MKKVLSVFSLLLMLTAMLGLSICGEGDAVADVADAETGPAEKDVMGIGVTLSILKVRKGPSVTAELVAALNSGQEVTVFEEENGYYRIAIEIEGEAEGSVETLEGYVKMEGIILKK